MSQFPIAEWMATQAGRVTSATLAGAVRLRYAATPVAAGQLRLASPTVAIDPGGAGRDVFLPIATQALVGLKLTIINAADAAEAIALKDETDGDAVVTVATIAQDELAQAICVEDGAVYRWQNLGVSTNT